MQSTITLFALAALLTGRAAHAQFTVDGTLAPAEVGTGVGKYQLVGTYTNQHSVADRGLKALYMGTTPTTLNVLAVASPEQAAYSALVLYLDAPNKTGIAAGTQLPGSSSSSSQLRHRPTLDMAADYGFRITVSPLNSSTNAMYLSRVDYTVAPTASGYAEIGMGSAAKNGTATSDPRDPTLANTAFQTSASGSVAANTTTGWEFSIPLAALGGAAAGSSFNVLVGYVADNGDFYSDLLPQVAGQFTDLGTNPNFTAIAGKQYYTYQVGSGVLASQTASAPPPASAYPNPVAADSRLAYSLSTLTPVRVAAYNSLGQLALTLLEEAAQPAGEHSLALAPLQALPAGLYTLRLEAGAKSSTQRVVVR
jgi:hypothetical protein